MLILHGRHLRPLGATSPDRFVTRITEDRALPMEQRSSETLLVRRPVPADLPRGFRAYLLHGGTDVDSPPNDAFVVAEPMRHLAAGDVVRIDPAARHVDVLYRRASTSNTFLVTERCDNLCVMCSQPPKSADDSWLVDDLRQAIPLIARDTAEIGISGGEPALLGEALIELVEQMRDHLPATAVHVLSNGRAFGKSGLARSLARVAHPDLMIGIPLYSDLAREHDYVVQAQGAFNETVRGILALKQHRVRVEVRFVIHADTVERMEEFARFVVRNLLFVDHVALMGLELMGFGKTNAEALWIDPVDYQSQLVGAVQTLDGAGMNVSVFNHQLCVLAPQLHPVARRSISDWKNEYFEPCEGCSRRAECGGFFSSSRDRRSRAIRPFASSTT